MQILVIFFTFSGMFVLYLMFFVPQNVMSEKI